MTPFTQNSTGQGTFTSRAPGSLRPAEFTAQQIEDLRARINEYNHPVIVFNSAFQPILLNEPLRNRLSEPLQLEGTGQPTAFVWQMICQTTAQIVSECVRRNSTSEIAEAFPAHQRCFAAVGSLIRNGSGQILGAIINLADLTGSRVKLQEIFGSGVPASHAGSDSTAEAYDQWTSRREEAQKKMSRLSRRESQVVALVSDGLPNKSIAHELDISVKTIEKHRANATRKLGVSSTAEMVRIAVIADDNKTVVPTPSTNSAGQKLDGPAV